MYHEIQHAVQDIEKFAFGSTSSGSHHTFSYGEIEARNVENKLNLCQKDLKKHPHLSSELSEKTRERNIKNYEKIEALNQKIENLTEEIEAYRDKLSDYSYSSRYTPEVYNKKFAILAKKNKDCRI